MITKIELLGWLGATKTQLAPLYTFITMVDLLSMDEAVIERTIAIRQNKKIALGDAIIAATALVHGLTLITRNMADFKNIEGLTLLDPYSIS